ncbi:MAG: hypothetical protein GX790_08365 [Syntrophomonadaceae bacterium]|nr:hypothetical protein [Syntrophomonadaceae bacterium]
MQLYSREFKDIIYEAELLKQDLTIMMENIVDLTRNLVDDMEAKAVNKNTIANANSPSQSLLYDNKNKLRVYELAQELNMDSNQLLSILKGLGNNYNSDFDFIDDQTAKIIKDFYNNIKNTALKPNPENNTLTEDYISKNYDQLDIEQIKNAHPYISVRILHEKGYDVKEIAKILDRGQGEVSLLLNLSKKAKVIQS